MRLNIRTLLPHLLAILLFMLLSAIYYAPQLQSYRVKQSDFETYLGMQKELADYEEKYDEESYWTNAMFSGMPGYQIRMKTPAHVNPINWLKTTFLEIFPRPWGYMIIGMTGFYLLLVWMGVNAWLAIVGAIAFGFSSINVLYFVAGHNSKIIAIALIPPLLGSVIYAFRKNLLVGAFFVAFFTALHLSANHLQMTYYALYLLLGVFLYEVFQFQKNNGWGAGLKRSLIIVVAGLLGLSPSLSQVYATYEYGKFTTRGASELTINADLSPKESSHKTALDRDYIKEYSLGAGESWSIVIPNIKGGTANYIQSRPDLLSQVNPNYREMVAQRNTYWGEQRFSGGAMYFGASVFLLFVLGLVFLKDRIKWVLFGVSALAVLLSWKYSALVDFFIDYVPLYNKFRDTKMMLILAQISFPLLGILVVQSFVKERPPLKKFLIVSGSVLLLFASFYVIPETFFSFSNRMEQDFMREQYSSYAGNSGALNQLAQFEEEVTKVRVAIMKEDVARSFLFALAVAGILLLFVMNKIKASVLYVLLGVVLLSDLWMVDKRYMNNEKQGKDYLYWTTKYDYHNPFRASRADASILNAEMEENASLRSLIREETSKLPKVGNLKSAEYNNEQEKLAFSLLNFETNYRVFSLQNPFNNSQTSYYHKFIGGYHGAKLKKYQELIDFYIGREYQYLSTVYSENPGNGQISREISSRIPVLNMLNMKYLILNPNQPALQNPGAWGNAWFPSDVKWVATADEELLALQDVNRSIAIVREEYRDQLQGTYTGASKASYELTDYLPNRLEYAIQVPQKQLVVFSEVYFPSGWKARIGDEELAIIPVNYLLRAVELPAGNHQLVFEFDSQEVKQGQLFGMIGSLLILLLGVWVLYRRYAHKQ